MEETLGSHDFSLSCEYPTYSGRSGGGGISHPSTSPRRARLQDGKLCAYHLQVLARPVRGEGFTDTWVLGGVNWEMNISKWQFFGVLGKVAIFITRLNPPLVVSSSGYIDQPPFYRP